MMFLIVQPRLVATNNFKTVAFSQKISQHSLRRYLNNAGSRLIFSRFGDPVDVVQKENEDIADPKDNEVLLKMLAAPVNPVDINIIQGKYPIKIEFPAVPGSEGVGEVVKAGAEVNKLAEGDHVVPLEGKLGLWRTYVNVTENKLLKVPKTLDIVQAAALTINPCTAYRVLRDYIELRPGDTVIQNGANSACGQNVIQMCRAWGLKTVNVIRTRPNFGEIRKYLTSLGATYVLSEEELLSTDIFKTGKIEQPRLALDCIGGKSALGILKHLQDGSSIVTYGGMSKDPVPIPTAALIFKDIHLCGFRISEWTKNNEKSEDRIKMFEEIIAMMNSNDLKAPAHELVEFSNYKYALKNTLTFKGMIGKKFILDFSK